MLDDLALGVVHIRPDGRRAGPRDDGGAWFAAGPARVGTNGLLWQGAILVRHAADVLDVLTGLPPLHVAAPPPAFTPEFLDGPLPEGQLARVRQALSPHPMPFDEIAPVSGLNAAQCSAGLMELEQAGEALTYPGGLVARAV